MYHVILLLAKQSSHGSKSIVEQLLANYVTEMSKLCHTNALMS